jgi:hypothetical protein
MADDVVGCGGVPDMPDASSAKRGEHGSLGVSSPALTIEIPEGRPLRQVVHDFLPSLSEENLIALDLNTHSGLQHT